jgi:long-chain fatty acid transport protein
MSRNRIALSCAALVLIAGAALAQSSAEVNAGIQYNFSSPGARSLARAGAFIADASDATAAYANPAGLVHVPTKEISLEGRSSQFVNSFSDRGHAFGPPSGVGHDVLSGIRTGRSDDRVQNFSFASVVVPLPRCTIAAYWHELANFAASASSQGVFYTLDDGVHRQYATVSSLRLRIGGAGVAVGFRPAPRLAFGLGARYYRSTIDSVTRRFETTALYGDPDYTRLNNVQTQHGHDTALGVNAGVLVEISPKLSVGGSYRQGFSFPVAVDYSDILNQQPIPQPTRTGSFNVPSFYGLGASIRPTDDWSIAVDVNHITYSDTTRNFVLLLMGEPRYFVPDGNEIRIGSELTLTRDRVESLPFPISIAVGAWRDPDHSIRVSDVQDSQSILFRRASADIHVTAGVGVLISNRAQFHAAIDRSSRQTVVSLSAMARF